MGSPLPVIDPWKHRSAGMTCATCMFHAPKEELPGVVTVGRCRRHAPTMGGYPVVFPADWCGDHKLDGAKVGPAVLEVPKGTLVFESYSGEIAASDLSASAYARKAATACAMAQGAPSGLLDRIKALRNTFPLNESFEQKRHDLAIAVILLAAVRNENPITAEEDGVVHTKGLPPEGVQL